MAFWFRIWGKAVMTTKKGKSVRCTVQYNEKLSPQFWIESWKTNKLQINMRQDELDNFYGTMSMLERQWYKEVVHIR